MRFLAGTKTWPDAPKAVHVMDCLRDMDEKVPGVLASYNALSEIAHPNWPGVSGLYSQNDKANFRAYFGRGLNGSNGVSEMIISAMLGSLDAFEYSYNRISDLMPTFLAELESIWPNEQDKPT